MSDMLIKGLEMPKSCYSDSVNHSECAFHYYSFWLQKDGCRISNCKCLKTKKPNDCPLKEIPDKHGRLGDLDKMRSDFEVVSKDYPEAWRLISGIIDRTPTILEATE